MALAGISGKVALVTGAARRRGIGRATALRLAAEGADVACLDIARPYADFPGYGVASGDELDEVVREVQALGRRAVALRADVSRWDEVHAAVASAQEALGGIDICCNVAGGAAMGMGAGPLLQISEREWDQVVDVNLKGTWIVSRACAERMLAGGRGGRIVNVSSQAGKRGFPMLGAYCAAKAGVVLLTQVLAQELGASGITVNAVCPGTVDTDLLNKDHAFEQMAGMLEGSLEKWIAREIPLRRLQTAEDVAATIAFLCSDDGGYITGEAVNVSGGQTMV
ncbi:MAG TPA: SDR family NAD(P)-dependent oxidoreductase [Candidatus Binatia bacterium]|jgi:NAD(P)-dependent dehydrogenase (short-subunit alcohol dehydrogenase family)|nr:SDR family NAD(P)-dependent oxidoreductase [Candidatus Binatia bacterium]